MSDPTKTITLVKDQEMQYCKKCEKLIEKKHTLGAGDGYRCDCYWVSIDVMEKKLFHHFPADWTAVLVTIRELVY